MMKLILFWLINATIALPLKIIVLIFKISYRVIKNIYFNNLDLEYIDNLDGFEFEVLTKIILEKNGFKNVTVSQNSSDYGIDVFATKRNYHYAIQCKRYAKTVGIKAVQEAKSGCDYYHCDIPVVFTNNNFSLSAIKLAKTTNVELWDRDILIRYLKKSKLLSKSLPFYYPLLAVLCSFGLGYAYFIYTNYLLIPWLISLFLLFSINIKIYKDKQKAPLIIKEPQFNLHDYRDTMQ